MSEEFIVQRTGVLGPPNTDRMFMVGETVTAEDFARCPHMFAKLKDRGSVVVADAAAAAAGRKVREENDKRYLGVPADTPRPEVLAILKERHDALEEEAKPKPVPTAAVEVPPEPAPTLDAALPAPDPNEAALRAQGRSEAETAARNEGPHQAQAVAEAKAAAAPYRVRPRDKGE